MITPTVSIIIPTHDRGDLLMEAVLSCLVQSYDSLDVVVVDDGSSEDISGVVDVLAGQARGGQHVRCLQQERRGGNVARNSGIREATGEFIQFLDSDDLLHPEKIAVQAARLLASPHLDMTCCLTEVFCTVPGDRRVLWNFPRVPGWEYDDLERLLLQDTVWHTGAPLWRRSAVERIGDWTPELVCWQDWDYNVKALCQRIAYDWTDEILFYARVHDGPSTCTIHSLLAREESCLLAGKLGQARLNDAGLLDARKRYLLMWYYLRHVDALLGANDHDGRALRAQFLKQAMTLCDQRTQTRVLRAMLMANTAMGGRFAVVYRMLKGLLERETIPAKPFNKTFPVLGPSPVPDSLLRAIESGMDSQTAKHANDAKG